MKNYFSIIIVFLFMAVLFFPKYGLENDTFYQSILTNGYFNAEATPFTMFSNYYFGLIIYYLELCYAGLNWHSLILFTILITAIGFIYSNIRSAFQCYHKYSALFLIVVIAIFSLPIIHLSFTLVSVVACLAGMSYFYLAAQLEFSLKDKRFSVALIFIFISSLIRFEATLYASLLIFAPLLVKIICYEGFIFKNYLKWFYLGGGILILISTFEFLSNYHYNRNPQWSHFLSFNKKRSTYYDLHSSFDKSKGNAFLINDVKDASLISQSFHYHHDLLNINKLPSLRSGEKIMSFEKIMSHLEDFKHIILFSQEFLIITILFFTILGWDNKRLVLYLLTIFYLATIYVVTCLLLKSANLRLHYGIIIVLLLVVTDLVVSFKRYKPKLIFVWPLVLIFGYGFAANLNLRDNRFYESSLLDKEMKSLFQKNTNIFFAHGSALPFENLSPFKNRSFLQEANFIPGTYVTAVNPWYEKIRNDSLFLLRDDLMYISHNFVWGDKMIKKSMQHPVEIKKYISYKYHIPIDSIKTEIVKKENRFQVLRFNYKDKGQ